MSNGGVDYYSVNYNEAEDARLSSSKASYGEEGQNDAEGGPFVNEGRQRVVTTTQTLVNLFKVYLGSGILGLPAAFRSGGLLASILVMCAVSVFTTHSMMMLVRAKRRAEQKNPDIVSFTDIAYLTYGRIGARLVDCLLMFTQYGFCCVYVVFVSQNTANFLPDWGWFVSWRMVVVWWIPVLIFLANLPTLKHMSFVAMFANFAISISIITILIAAFVQISDDLDPPPGTKVPSHDWWIVPNTLALMFGVAIYAFEGIGVVIPAETAMKEPQNFIKVLMVTMLGSSINYMSFGLICYLAWGTDTEDLVTVNLRDFADGYLPWQILYTCVTIGLIIAIAATYPIQLFVVTDIIEEAMFKPGRLSPRFRFFKVFAFRSLLVLGTVGIAIGVPDFNLLMGLIGSLGCTTLQFIFPGMFCLKLFPEAPLYQKAISVFYILFGLAGGGLGTYQTISELIKKYT